MAKRITLEEKRERLLGLFTESKDVYQLKDVEKLASKKIGIAVPVVREVLQGLVDDELVSKERIGSTNYFWSFPSQQIVKRKNAINKYKSDLAKLDEDLEALNGVLKESEKARRDKERQKKIEIYDNLKKDVEEQETQLKEYSETDPDVYEERKSEMAKIKSDANRVVDAIYEIRRFLIEKFGIDSGDLDRRFGLEEGIDYI